ncbi:MAG: cytochrome c biogenesis protein CcsA [Gemmatimonadota bacterium]
MIPILHVASFALYGIAGALLGVSLAREARRLTVVAMVVFAVGLGVHGLGLAEFASTWDQLPLVGLGPSLSTLAFLVGLGCVVAATLGHASTVGLVLVPIVAALTAVAAAVGIAPNGDPTAYRGGWGLLHVIFAFVGLTGLAVAFAAGLMYLLQFRELKSKHFGAVFRFFPPLETLDRLGRRGLLVGFPFLTLALVLGWAWTVSFNEPSAPGTPKLVWVAAIVGVFLSSLLARTGAGRKAERGALASVIGFVVVVVLYMILRAQAAPEGAFL